MFLKVATNSGSVITAILTEIEARSWTSNQRSIFACRGFAVESQLILSLHILSLPSPSLMIEMEARSLHTDHCVRGVCDGMGYESFSQLISAILSVLLFSSFLWGSVVSQYLY